MPETAHNATIDLLSPKTVFVNRLPDMGGVVERLFRHFRTLLFQEFRLNLRSLDGKFEIVSHDAYLAPRCNYSLYGILNIPPIKGLSLVRLEGPLLAALVDDLFGADASDAQPTEAMQISIMETRIGRRLMDMMVAAINAALQQYVPVQAEVIRTEGYSALATVGDASEPFCAMSAQLDLPTGGGGVSIAIPYRGLEPFREILGAPAAGQAQKDATSRWADGIAGAIEDVPVEISFDIGTTSMSMAALATLAPGDVLPLTFHRNARAMIGDTEIARITYGAVGSNYGVFFGNDQQDQ